MEPGKEETLPSMAAQVKDETLSLMAQGKGEAKETASESETDVSLGAQLRNGGEILVLVETPSGFALFGYVGRKLSVPYAIKNIWSDFFMPHMAEKVVCLKEFKPFDDKTSAIKLDTGANEQLTTMIRKWIQPGQQLAVGKSEYKDIIEENLRIPCLWSEEVMEVIWGLNLQMRFLVPEEQSKLTAYCFPICKGMKFVLDHHCFNVKTQVYRSIIEATGVLYECDSCVDKYSEPLRGYARHLTNISRMDIQGWDVMLIATALKIVCYPEEKIAAGNPVKLFPNGGYEKLRKDAPKYVPVLDKAHCLAVYEEILRARRTMCNAVRMLTNLIEQANKELHNFDQAGQ